jgi:hypothetical protein
MQDGAFSGASRTYGKDQSVIALKRREDIARLRPVNRRQK